MKRRRISVTKSHRPEIHIYFIVSSASYQTTALFHNSTGHKNKNKNKLGRLKLYRRTKHPEVIILKSVCIWNVLLKKNNRAWHSLRVGYFRYYCTSGVQNTMSITFAFERTRRRWSDKACDGNGKQTGPRNTVRQTTVAWWARPALELDSWNVWLNIRCFPKTASIVKLKRKALWWRATSSLFPHTRQRYISNHTTG